MKPDWDQLANEFKGSQHLLVADVDCTSDTGKSLCAKHEINGYPTLKTFYKDGSVVDYAGPRDLDSLRHHAQALGPGFVERLTMTQKALLALAIAFVVYIGGQVARLW